MILSIYMTTDTIWIQLLTPRCYNQPKEKKLLGLFINRVAKLATSIFKCIYFIYTTHNYLYSTFKNINQFCKKTVSTKLNHKMDRVEANCPEDTKESWP